MLAFALLLLFQSYLSPCLTAILPFGNSATLIVFQSYLSPCLTHYGEIGAETRRVETFNPTLVRV